MQPDLGVCNEQEAIPYEYALGFAPQFDASETGSGVGFVADIEAFGRVDMKLIARPRFRIWARDFNAEKKTSLQRESTAELGLGARHYLTPNLDSWVFAGIVSAQVTTSTFIQANDELVQREWRSIDIHLAGGYRWMWPSKLYVLLGAGPLIPIFDEFQRVHSGNRHTEWFWGSWTVAGSSGIGIVF